MELGRRSLPAVLAAVVISTSSGIAAADLDGLTAEQLCDLVPTQTLTLDAGDGIPDVETRYGPGTEGDIRFCGRAFGGYVDDDGIRVNAGGAWVMLYAAPGGAEAEFTQFTDRPQFSFPDAGIGERYAEAVDFDDTLWLLAVRGPFMFQVVGLPEEGDLRGAMREMDENIQAVIADLGSGAGVPPDKPDDPGPGDGSDGGAGEDSDGGAGDGSDDGTSSTDDGSAQTATMSFEDIATEIMAAGYAGGTDQPFETVRVPFFDAVADRTGCGAVREESSPCTEAFDQSDFVVASLLDEIGSSAESLTDSEFASLANARDVAFLSNLADAEGKAFFPGVRAAEPVLVRLARGGVKGSQADREALRFVLAQLIGLDMLGWGQS